MWSTHSPAGARAIGVCSRRIWKHTRRLTVMRIRILVLVLLSCLATAARSLPVDPPDVGEDRWWNGFRPPGLGVSDNGPDHMVRLLEVFDGELIVGGKLRIESPEHITDTARWDGATWRALGDGPGGIIAFGVRHGAALLCVVERNPLQLRAWDGTGWTTLCDIVLACDQQRLRASADGGKTPRLQCIASCNGEIVVGGSFDAINGQPATNVAAWDGTRWHALGGGLSVPHPHHGWGRVNALAVYRDALVAAGYFSTSSDGQLLQDIARWDGVAWQPLGEGLAGEVYNLAARADELYALGYFSPSEAAAKELMRWDGRAWKSFTPLLPRGWFPECIAASSRGLVVSGGVPSGFDFGIYYWPFESQSRLWNGRTWDVLCQSVGNGFVSQVADFGSMLVAGGCFMSVEDAAANGLAFLTADGWQTAVPGTALAARDDGNGFMADASTFLTDGTDLLVGGHFEFAGDRRSQGAALWTGSSWSPLGRGTDGDVAAFARWNGLLVASGSFTQAGDAAAKNVATWDGTQWRALGEGLGPAGVRALAVHDGALVAGGSFQKSGNRWIFAVARWDGSAWQPLHHLFYDVDDLAVFHGELLAAGRFNWDGTRAVGPVVRWTGSDWQTLGTIRGSVRHLRILGDVLYAIGSVALEAGSNAPLYRVVRWDGSAWQPVGGRPDLYIADVAAYGGELVASAAYYTEYPDHGTVNGRLYRLQDGVWQPLSRALRCVPTTLAVYDGSLYCGGHIYDANFASIGIARWDGGPVAVAIEDARAEAMDDGGIRLAWRVARDAQGGSIEVLRAATAAGPFESRALLPASDGASPHGATWLDTDVVPGHSYWYALRMAAAAGAVTRSGPWAVTARAWATSLEPVALPAAGQPVHIAFRAGRAGVARLELYDVRGRRVRALARLQVLPGRHVVHWDQTDERGAAIAHGLYFVRLELDGRQLVRKVLAGRR